MPRDRSLDEFLAGSEAESDAEVDDGDLEPESESEPETESVTGPEEANEAARAADAEDVVDAEPAIEPMATTYGWSPDGGECTACGEVVEARWRDDGDLVCEACKEW